MKPPVFSITPREQDGGVLLALSGELDLAGVPTLTEALGRARTAGGTLTVDLSGLEFIDSSGLGVLVRFNNAAAASGYEYCVIAGPPQVHRAFELAGLDRALPFAGNPAS